MQMGETGFPVDVVRMPGRCRDAAVDRLAALAYHDQIVDQAVPQRSEYLFPWPGQGTVGRAERCRYSGPRGIAVGAVYQDSSFKPRTCQPEGTFIRHGARPAFGPARAVA